MGKLLITFTEPQEAWLRGEAERLGLPGRVSELVRRTVDFCRGEMPMRTFGEVEPVIAEVTEAQPGTRLVPETRLEKALLRQIIATSEIATRRYPVCGTEVEGSHEACFELSNSSAWDEQGRLSGFLRVDDLKHDDIHHMLDGFEVFPAFFSVEVGPEDRIHVVYHVPGNPYTGGLDQTNGVADGIYLAQNWGKGAA